jgi:aliphatic nitrilase
MSQTKYKVAVIQAAPVFLDLDKTIDKTITLIEEASANGAKLIAFPETWLPGYPWWIWTGSPAFGMRFIQQYHQNSLVYGSEQAERIQKAAKDHNISVFMGISEKEAGSLYMGQWLIDADGNSVIQRRKLKPTHVERSVFGEGDGSDLIVKETELGRIGGLCCWEHIQPLSKYAMYSQNEQVHIGAWPSFSVYRGAANALGAEVNNAASQIYAVEGSCYVLAPCATISKEMIEMLNGDDPIKNQLLLEGGGFSVIYGPDGSLLTDRIQENEEGILYADIDLSAIALSKSVADPTGHYSRPDVTQLVFNNKPQRPVIGTYEESSFQQEEEIENVEE